MLITWKEKLPHLIALVTSVFMLANPIADMVDRGVMYIPVLSVFGLIMLNLSVRTLWNMRKHTEVQVKDRNNLFRHINYMGGSYISAFTAFAVTNLAFGPSWLPWLAPTAVGTLIITWANVKWQNKFKPKKTPLIILLISASSLPLLSQDQTSRISGQILDENQNPIPYVSIGIPGSSVGTVSDEKGFYELHIDANRFKDSVLFSSLGYQKVMLTGQSLQRSANVMMHTATSTLPEVLVRPGKLKRIKLGTESSRSTMTTNLAISNKPSMNLGAAIGKKFHPGSRFFYPDTFSFYLQYNNFDTVVFRIQIYEVSWGKPDKAILNQDVLLTITGKRKGWQQVDLSPYHLSIKHNFIVAVEWVGQSIKGSFLGIPIKMPLPGAEHYYRYGSQNHWKRFVAMTTPMNIKGFQ